MCELLVGLVDVTVLGVEDSGGDGPLVVAIETTTSIATCPNWTLLDRIHPAEPDEPHS